MPRGRTTTLSVTLTYRQRRTLEAWQRASTMPVGLVRRGRIILLVAEGRTITQIVHAVGLARRHVYKWVKRFQAQGCAGLADRPRPSPAQRRRQEAAP